MDKKKTVFLLLVLLFTAVFTFVTVKIGLSIHAKLYAEIEVDEETKRIEDDNEFLRNKEEIIKSDIETKSDELSEKEKLNKEISEKKSEANKYKKDRQALEKEAEKYKEDTEPLKAELEKLETGMNLKKGKTITASDEIISCPDDIAEGRYVISGTESFSIMAVSGSARVSENLSNLDTKTYTFDIEKGEMIKVSGDAKITGLK